MSQKVVRITENSFNTLSDQGTFTPVGAGGGGFLGTLPYKTTFPAEFCNEICTLYVWTVKKHNSTKKKKKKKKKTWKWKCYTVSKWRPNNKFLFHINSFLPVLGT